MHIVGNDHFELRLDSSAGCGEIYHLEHGKNPMLMGRIRYLARMIDGPGGDMKDLEIVSSSLKKHDDFSCLEIACGSRGVLSVRMLIRSGKGESGFHIEVVAENVSRKAQTIGLRTFCVDLACDTIRARFLPGLYSGWTCEGRSLVMYPEFVEGVSNRMGLVTDYEKPDPMCIVTDRQGCALNVPSVMRGGVAELDPGERCFGAMTVRLGHDDVWDPVLLETARQYCVPGNGIQLPAHSYDRHIGNWKKFITREDLWVPMGKQAGMFHRGFYGMIRFGEQRVSGPLRYDGDRCIGTGNERLIELSWGGSNNALLAYTMFTHGADWAVKKGGEIINATCSVGGKGFQQIEGPCAGAWHNGYYPDLDRFADRYFRDTIYTPDQGIANYFLGKCLLEGFTEKAELAAMINRNCTEYLPRLDNGLGGLVMARRSDGSPGVDRYGRVYDGDKADLAMPAAMGSLSYLMDYRVNGSRSSLAEGERLLEHTLRKVEANEWRFHEYDTWGWDNMSMCWILTVLCEWLKETPDARIDGGVEKTLQALLSCRFAVDFGLEGYSDLERCWGGRMVSRGGFVGGSSVGSMHGGNSLHNRFDASLALWTHFRTKADPRSYEALLDFLNNLTYHQWKRTDLSIGLGAVTEAIHLDEGHVQDTAQTLHSNCLYHILVNRQLFLESSTAPLASIGLPETSSDPLVFSLLASPAGSHRVSFGGTGGRHVRLSIDGATVYVGPGTDVGLELTSRGKKYVIEVTGL